ncbi:MAG: o-succinylbenzoate synthase [Microbacteriaceae bacterium]
MTESFAVPDLTELLSTLRVVTLPLNTKFRGVTQREIALFEGPEGWSEFSPFLEYEAAESSQWLRAAIEFAWMPTPPPLRKMIPVNATLPAVSTEDVEKVLARYGTFGTVKVKVAERGQSLADDVARLARVRELYPDVKLRIDANGAWTILRAREALAQLAEFELEYVEQPCATVEELAELRSEGLGLLIAADESIRKAADPYRVAELEAADLMVVKAQPLGGIERVLKLIEELPLQAVVSSALESSIGLSQGLALAAAPPELNYASGLGTATLFAQDIVTEPLLMCDGMLELRRPVPDAALLGKHQSTPEREAWWRERITDCYSLLSN